MEPIVERFLRYVSFDTTSSEETGTTPSTPNQMELARVLEKELKQEGFSEVSLSEHGTVFATVPANCVGAPVLGLIAHMDTSPAAAGANIHPRLVKYQGGDVALDAAGTVVLRESEQSMLKELVGKTLIVPDGTTLLGADDKAGIAEIITAALRLMQPDAPAHGKIRLAFTPDEEIGEGTRFFDLEAFGAEIAYTVDGGALGEIEYESFNAATAYVTVHGVSVHTGSAKNKMRNALFLAHEFQAMLPPAEIPACTEGYEGFYHLRLVQGDVEQCRMIYNLREHDSEKFAAQKARVRKITDYLNEKYGEGTFKLELKEGYANMCEGLKDHMELIESAKAAFEAHGVVPCTPPIRGGTDGAALTLRGLPCPNLSTGGYNFHGRYEFIPLEAMQTMTDVLVTLANSFVTK